MTLHVDRTCSCLEWRVRNPWSGPGVCSGHNGCNLRPRQPERYKIMKSILDGQIQIQRMGWRNYAYDATEWKKAWYLTIREWYYYGITKT